MTAAATASRGFWPTVEEGLPGLAGVAGTGTGAGRGSAASADAVAATPVGAGAAFASGAATVARADDSPVAAGERAMAGATPPVARTTAARAMKSGRRWAANGRRAGRSRSGWWAMAQASAPASRRSVARWSGRR